ncbi:Dihydrodipicolinate synthase/N-acetylneuraminate lyase [Actinopolyspora mzabensis]|uniref:Dihydrodipicolinate synthase/N-acetylneuraminate lyase n=1 Tax=Actinopolyspora mzabensis TaxID=995066 RepID=A0A1G9EFP4_ACTMZ|nr:dihydrodipicolinate synthase family protein [Actinopolyspora mzabensis]SDK74883.1 Dihydrodipicolinate synthase/N-acetylneuraminate lyase [Actinopolyspora mzabensis]
MSRTIHLPRSDGSLHSHHLHEPVTRSLPTEPPASRIAYAAAHVVADPFGENTPGSAAEIDWNSTLAFRRHLWECGLGVAEAMDTAQRGMGLDWDATRELIRRSGEEAARVGGRIAAGVGTDHLSPQVTDLDELIDGYREQLDVTQRAGARVILMASRQLAAAATGPADYRKVYDKLLAEVEQPAILHWLGPAFDPALAGYWGSNDIDEAADSLLEILHGHPERVDGVKVSLLDAEHEIRLRERLPEGVRLYTGDDFNYPRLIKGESGSHSDALLGVFAAIAPAAAAALHALDEGDEARFDEILDPTVPLARQLFARPTYYYKTGIAFLAWLRGQQPGFGMVGGLQSGRSIVHLAEVFRLADRAGTLPDPDRAADRMRGLLEIAGVTR